MPGNRGLRMFADSKGLGTALRISRKLGLPADRLRTCLSLLRRQSRSILRLRFLVSLLLIVVQE